MASALPASAPGLSALDLLNINPPAAGKLTAAGKAKAHAAAQDLRRRGQGQPAPAQAARSTPSVYPPAGCCAD